VFVGGEGRRGRGEVRLLQIPQLNPFLAIELRFLRAVGVYAAFGKEVGTAAGDYQGRPSVTWDVLVCVDMREGDEGVMRWGSSG
jgi:hypothetical protein